MLPIRENWKPNKEEKRILKLILISDNKNYNNNNKINKIVKIFALSFGH